MIKLKVHDKIQGACLMFYIAGQKLQIMQTIIQITIGATSVFFMFSGSQINCFY